MINLSLKTFFPVNFGRDLTLRGRGRIVLKPKMSKPPFFGGVQFCLLDEIDIDFDLEGLADICDTWSFVRRKIR